MKRRILAAIRCSLMFTALTASVFCVQPAQAYKVTLREVGSDVVATGSGPINLTGLTPSTPSRAGAAAQINAGVGVILTGSGSIVFYNGVTGPTSFGSGNVFFASTSSENPVGMSAAFFNDVIVPEGYVSGTSLSDSMT